MKDGAIAMFIALGLAVSFAFNLHFVEKLDRHTTTLVACISGGSFVVKPERSPTGRGRIVHCVVTDTHEGVKK